MLVRESPKAKVSPDKNTANWPPKSPYEALLSSPSGRKKWQEHRHRMNERSPSPSPLRKPLASSKALQALAMASDNEQDENPSDEDEETLQLKLQAIEAKLKLKKLQQAKTKNARRARSPSEDVSESASPRKRLKVSVFPAADVQIPVSPAKDRIKAPQQDTSPARILLGIDKGLRAQDVSLKRPRPGPIFDRSEPKLAAAAPEPRIKSFSERIAESRTNDQAQETKEERIQKARSKGFSLSRPLDASPDTPKPRNTGLRTDGAPSRQCKDTSRNTQSSSQPSSHPAARFSQSSTSASALQASQRPRTSKPESHSDSTNNNNQLLRSSSAEPSADSSSFDPYSSLHLTKRTIPHVDLARTLAGKEIYTLPRLLKEVKSPHYDPPDCEADFVVFAILAAKSTPYDHKPAHHSTGEDETGPLGAPKNKFMVLKLTDLNWELDCFLFDTAFSQYWKLTPGTLLAILNPSIMPPRKPHSSSVSENGRFSLKLASSEDGVLEIGTARDLGFCKSIKKDGRQCEEWINARKTEHCEFHVNLEIDKARKGRMEFNTMHRFAGPASRKLADGEFKCRTDPRQRDSVTGEMYYMGGKSGLGGMGGMSAAKALDFEDREKSVAAMQKRLKEKEKERLLAEKLGKMGNLGMGAEYLRQRQRTPDTVTSTSSSNSSSKRTGGVAGNASVAKAGRSRGGGRSSSPEKKTSAAELGLIGSASTARLGRERSERTENIIGRKRALNSSTSTTASGPEAMGWSGAFKRGLLDRPERSPERGQTTLGFARSKEDGSESCRGSNGRREGSPKKKARFMLERGIREPGRESLGDAVGMGASDDELEIIR